MADPDTFRVSPSLQGLPALTAPEVENQGPAMLVKAGTTVTRMAGVASQLYERELQEQNATRVTEALQQATQYGHKLTYDPTSGWASQVGKLAVDRAEPLDEEIGSSFENYAEQLAMNLGNDAQRKLFQSRIGDMALDLRGRVQNHVAQEGFKYRQEVLTGLVTDNNKLMGEATDPIDQERYGSMVRQAANQLADMRGIADTQRDNFIREAMTPGHLAVLGRLSDADDIAAAEAYFNQNRDELTLDASSKVEGVLLEQRTLANGYDIGDAFFEHGQAVNSAAAPEDVGLPVHGAFARTGNFGDQRPGHKHGGIDMAVRAGTPVYAGASGTARIKRDPDGYGLYVDLKLDNGTTLRTAHLSETKIEDGQRVNKGEVLALSGSSGRSTGPHVHYEVIGPDGVKVDPLTWHEGGPKASPAGQTGMTRQQMVDEVMSRNLPPKTEKAALERIDYRFRVRKEAEDEAKDTTLSNAYAEIDRTGRLSNGTRAALVGAGLGSNIPSLRGFEKSKAEAAAGGAVSAENSMVAYGTARQMMAEGKIKSMEDLLPLRYSMAPGLYKQLVDDVTKSPQDARTRADATINLMNEEIKGSGLFVNKDGKEDADTKKQYSRFVGAVTRQIEQEEVATGKPVDAARQRQIVLGFIGQQSIDALGINEPGYRVREYYDRVPKGEQARIVRDLQRRGLPASQRMVVSEWLRIHGQGK